MAPNQPRKAGVERLNVPTLSRPSGISKSRGSPIVSSISPRTQLTEDAVHNRSLSPHQEDHAYVRRQQSSSFKLAPPTQNYRAQAPQAQQESLVSRQQPPVVTANGRPPIFVPKVLHRPHPKSKLCEDFHWIPYPLGLMPYESWLFMHHRNPRGLGYKFLCPVCHQERNATAHARKVFLVAERLSWIDTIVPIQERDLNEELNWAVNYELGITEPYVEDETQIPGGRKSQGNRFYPYQNEHEMMLALKLIFMSEELTPVTWAMWIEAQMTLQELLDGEELGQDGAGSNSRHTNGGPGNDVASMQQNSPELIELIDLTGSPEPELKHHPTLPPASLRQANNSFDQPNSTNNDTQYWQKISTPPQQSQQQPSRRIQSYKTLQDFYSLLDKIERTSFVGALFLEAYAERLRDDMCKSCWFRHNVNLDLF